MGSNVGFGTALSSTAGQRVTAYPKVNGKIWATVPDDSGGWYIGGDFSKVGSYDRARLAHILADGRVDGDWNPGADNTVRALVRSSDGKRLYAGGAFTKVGGASRNRLAVLSAVTGTVDSAWNPNANNAVNPWRYRRTVGQSMPEEPSPALAARAAATWRP